MSLEAFHAEIRRFLSNGDAEVLVVMGKWGVGKTFAWNAQLTKARENGGIHPARYAYVSLFGLGSLTELKAAIFQNTVPREKAGVSADLKTLEGALDTIRSHWRQGMSLVRSAPKVGEYASALQMLGFFSVKDQIICIDDLERRSKSLDMRDVLGLISYLKEQRNCKIVVLLNDEKLGPDDKEFTIQIEKVADIEVKFEPTPEEAAAIGVDENVSFRERVHTHCVALGIVNIRTIKKIERLAKRLEEELNSFDPRVFEQALASAALFAYSKYQPDVAPSMEFLQSYNPYSGLFGKRGEGVSHPEWRELLREYQFTHLDAFDEVILDGILSGHFDLDRLHTEAATAQTRIRNADDDQAFQEAWELYHNSFDANQQEIMDRLVQAVRTTPRAISPINLSGTIQLLKDLNWDGDINALVQEYVDGRPDEPRAFWDLNKSMMGGDVTDPDVRAAFAAKAASIHDDRDIAQVLMSIGKARGWSPDDVEFLASQAADAYYDVFKRLHDEELRLAIAGGLMFRDVGGTDENMKAVTALTEEALRRVGKESSINLRRVMQKGVDVPADDEPAGPAA